MQKKKSLIALGLTAALLLTLFASCGKKGYSFGTDEKGRTMNEKTGVVYLIAPDCYGPLAVEEEVFGTSGSNVYYALQGVDPAKWLYGKLGMLFYAEDVTLPTLEQMNISRIALLSSDGSPVGEIKDEAVIREAVQGYAQGENEPYSGWIVPLTKHILRFEDASLGIYYEVNYLEYQGKSEGERVAYLYCRGEKRFVAVGDSLRTAVTAIIGAEETE